MRLPDGDRVAGGAGDSIDANDHAGAARIGGRRRVSEADVAVGGRGDGGGGVGGARAARDHDHDHDYDCGGGCDYGEVADLALAGDVEVRARQWSELRCERAGESLVQAGFPDVGRVCRRRAQRLLVGVRPHRRLHDRAVGGHCLERAAARSAALRRLFRAGRSVGRPRRGVRRAHRAASDPRLRHVAVAVGGVREDRADRRQRTCAGSIRSPPACCSTRFRRR